ncbi:hypothetical protein CRG98_049603, partial [Punica granatum]
MALGAADASPWSIRTSPTLNRPESGGVGVKLRFSGEVSSSPISKFAKSRANFLFFLTGSCLCPSELPFLSINFNFVRFSVEISVDLGGNRGNLLCALEFHLVGARMCAPKQTRLGSVHLPGDTRRTH